MHHEGLGGTRHYAICLESMFICHFADPHLGVKTFFDKMGQQNKGVLILE